MKGWLARSPIPAINLVRMTGGCRFCKMLGAHTQPTADAGVLAGRIMGNLSEIIDNRERARQSLNLLRKCGPPSQELLYLSDKNKADIGTTHACKLLEKCDAIFVTLETKHQQLLQNIKIDSKEEKNQARKK